MDWKPDAGGFAERQKAKAFQLLKETNVPDGDFTYEAFAMFMSREFPKRTYLKRALNENLISFAVHESVPGLVAPTIYMRGVYQNDGNWQIPVRPYTLAFLEGFVDAFAHHQDFLKPTIAFPLQYWGVLHSPRPLNPLWVGGKNEQLITWAAWFTGHHLPEEIYSPAT